MDEPKTREEAFLAKIAGEEVPLPKPETREELYLAKIAGEDVVIPDKPITRTEQYLSAIVENGGGGGGGGVEVEALSVTQNDTYTAPEGKAYSPVTVNVSSVEKITLVEETEFVGVLPAPGYPFYMAAIPSAGFDNDHIIVTYDGTQYECDADVEATAVFYGAALDMGTGTIDFSEYPFLIMTEPDTSLIQIITPDGNTHTLKAETEIEPVYPTGTIQIAADGIYNIEQYARAEVAARNFGQKTIPLNFVNNIDSAKIAVYFTAPDGEYKYIFVNANSSIDLPLAKNTNAFAGTKYCINVWVQLSNGSTGRYLSVDGEHMTGEFNFSYVPSSSFWFTVYVSEADINDGASLTVTYS